MMPFAMPMAAGMPQRPTNIDFDRMSIEEIKSHLKSRGLKSKGKNRETLLERLRTEIDKAWKEFYTGGGGKKQKKRAPKRKREKLSPEEQARVDEERRIAREAKLKRKEENKRKMEEAREAKRLKKEAAKERQKNLEEEQKKAKEQKQRTQIFVNLDMEVFAKKVSKLLDPSQKKITSCSYDFAHHGFSVRFANAADAERAARVSQGRASTMSKPKTLQIKMNLQALAAPVESKCVFFLDPVHPGNEYRSENYEWMGSEYSVEEKRTPDNKSLAATKEAALKEFQKYGPICNIYRERGFIVLQYVTEAGAKKMFKSNQDGTFHGQPLVWLREGTPKKRDRLEHDKTWKPEKKATKKATKN